MYIGKEITVLENGLLSFADDIVHPEPEIRYLADVLNVLYHRPEDFDNVPLYYIYRGVMKEEDRDLFPEHNLRYDITVILPGLIEREYYKTVGHFHPLKPNSNETYSEYYEVLAGEALYLMQKNNRSGEPEEVRVVAAKKGDRVYIPSGFGHVTINPGDEPLVTANLVNGSMEPNYQPFAEKQGAAYYYILTEHNKGDFVKNPNYLQSCGLELVCAPNLPQPVELNNKSLYQAFVEQPKQFQFLK
ncbi:MAG TPA: glucose-6-phosphate isomerase [Clostridia bacterium]|nr:glucose-6-phosphate isomerase [Clostridia bacterium]